MGLPAEWDADAQVPFLYHGGVRLAEQAQFDPMPFLGSRRHFPGAALTHFWSQDYTPRR